MMADNEGKNIAMAASVDCGVFLIVVVVFFAGVAASAEQHVPLTLRRGDSSIATNNAITKLID